MKPPVILDRWGNPIERKQLTAEVAAPTIGSVRSPMTGYPGDGLDPARLASILRQADQGDAVQYLELAETIEERDPHYLGVLGTRRRSVAQIEITVEAASDEAEDVARADLVRAWLKRDELADEIFDILDCLSKGIGFTEIIWDTSEGQWQPGRLEYRDPRWFRFDRRNLTTPLLLGEGGEELPLTPFKFITSMIKAKSGLPLRSGLARVASWGWMFKAYTQRDWAVFTQTYGQPLRVGKYQPGATEKDKAELYRAISNIAGDCAAMIPEGMMIEFIAAGNISATVDLYEKRADWLDKQISKAVLGQTATTDAVTGGLGSGQEHREVQEDIERADARALSAILNRDLIQPWMQLEFGPLKAYPRLKIVRPEPDDLAALSTALGTLVPLGLKVRQVEVRERFGLSEPAEDDDLLVPAKASAPPPPAPGQESRVLPADPPQPARQAAEPSPTLPTADQVARIAEEAAPDVRAMLEVIEVMVGRAESLEELRAMLLAAFPQLDGAGLTDRLSGALAAAALLGRAEVAEEEARG